MESFWGFCEFSKTVVDRAFFFNCKYFKLLTWNFLDTATCQVKNTSVGLHIPFSIEVSKRRQL